MAYRATFIFINNEVIEFDNEGYDPDENMFYIDYDIMGDNVVAEAEEIYVSVICDDCDAEITYSAEIECHRFDLEPINKLSLLDGWLLDYELQICTHCKANQS